jgi:hypothetical protein
VAVVAEDAHARVVLGGVAASAPRLATDSGNCRSAWPGPWRSPGQQAEFAATAQAQGGSLAQAHALCAVPRGPATPSRATLGRLARDAGRAAGPVAADAICSGRKPIRLTLEQDRLGWPGGRRADNRDGASWAQEPAPRAAAAQVTSDGGPGWRRSTATGAGLACRRSGTRATTHRARRAVRPVRQ